MFAIIYNRTRNIAIFLSPFFSDLLCRYSTAFCNVFKLLWITKIILRWSKLCIKHKTWICLNNREYETQFTWPLPWGMRLCTDATSTSSSAHETNMYTCINKIILTISDILFFMNLTVNDNSTIQYFNCHHTQGNSLCFFIHYLNVLLMLYIHFCIWYTKRLKCTGYPEFL